MLAIFVHRRAPGQFVHLIDRLLERGCDVIVVAEDFDRPSAGARHVRYDVAASRPGSTPPAMLAFDYHVRTGEAVAAVLDGLRRRGCRPDMIVGHTGWGGLLFAKDVYPGVPVLGYCEFYHQVGSDVAFGVDPEDVPFAERARIRLRNAAQLTTLAAIDAGISPTRWQRDGYPPAVRTGIALCHDGIDTRLCSPRRDAYLTLPDGRTLSAADRVVTYAARDLEPYRGFPQFLDMAKDVAKAHPDIVFVAVGSDGVSYGARRDDGRSWRVAEMERTGLDPSRIHFTGWLPHSDLIRLFQLSSVHVYLTVPFVLSWSLLEALACGCLVVGSATRPVQEVIDHGRNGFLVDLFDQESLAARVLDAVARPEAFRQVRSNARDSVQQNYGLEECLRQQLDLLDVLSGGRLDSESWLS